MCEFCLKHGEGQKWYLNAKNYSEDLLSDISRNKYIAEFLTRPSAIAAGERWVSRIEKAPLPIRAALRRLVTRKMKPVHFGQVVPIEEIEKIFEFVNSVVRVACVCRHVTQKKEARYCYGLSISPNGGKLKDILEGLDNSFLNGPESAGLEVLSTEEALASIREHEEEGLCHTIWTFQSPFIAGICNCNTNDCLAMRCTVQHETPVMFKAEYKAWIDSELCTGCQSCLSTCNFNAMSYQSEENKVSIDPDRCYGCGVCRPACSENAIELSEKPSSLEK